MFLNWTEISPKPVFLFKPWRFNWASQIKASWKEKLRLSESLRTVKPVSNAALKSPKNPLWFGESGCCLWCSWGFSCGLLTRVWLSWNLTLINWALMQISSSVPVLRSVYQHQSSSSSSFSPGAAASFSFASCCWMCDSVCLCASTGVCLTTLWPQDVVESR